MSSLELIPSGDRIELQNKRRLQEWARLLRAELLGLIEQIDNHADRLLPEGGTPGSVLVAGSGSDAEWGIVPAHDHDASEVVSGTIDTARLGSGTADNTTFLRGDQTWQVVTGGSGGLSHPQVLARTLGA